MPSYKLLTESNALHFYRPHTKYREGYVFSVSVLLFTGGGGRGGEVKIEKCSECHRKPKKCIKIFSDYTSFDQVGGGGGGVKIEKCSECHGKPKKCIKIFSDYTSFDQVGGGGGLKFKCLFLQENSNFNML